MKSAIPFALVSFGALALGLASPWSAQPTAKVVFGRDVMPILGQRCFKCHGPDAATVAAGLRLDSAKGAARVLVPGHPEKSELIHRVSSKDDRMPPPDSGVKPLTEDQIQTLKTWIKQGAPYEKHWAYVPPKMPLLPKVQNTTWEKNPIDRFVHAKLEAANLKPEPEADKDTLALRAAQTLTGLPPTPQELNLFRQDKQPGAYERYVDRLLAKPAYGEHEARYWMDAVRYGDTHGLQLDNERGIFPYRDWVVRAYNQDLPFTKFVEWQLAGDLLPNPTTEQLIATGYVRSNLTSAEGGAIEAEFLARNTFDRVDTTSTVMLGLTVACAKCHDHKYDPIKHRDYYGLYAYFNSTADAPLDGNALLPPPVIRAASPKEAAMLKAMDGTLAAIRKSVPPAVAVDALSKLNTGAITAKDWQRTPAYVQASFDQAFDQAEPAEPGQTGLVDWKPLKLEMGKDIPGLIGKDAASVYVRGTVTLAQARQVKFGVSSDDGIKIWLNSKLIHAKKVTRATTTEIDQVTGDFRAGDNELVLKVTNGAGPDGLILRLVDANEQRIATALANPKNVDELQAAYLELGPTTPQSERYRKTLRARNDLDAAIPMSLIAQEMPKPRPTFILKRGQYDQPGDPVTRHLPAFLGTLPKGAPNNRLGLARWMISPDNPLVARVYVNRVWQQHFGTAIVKTAEDFGSQGEWPLNQPLLDYLAVSFRENGWSVKKLNRLIVTSAAFRQSSKISKAKLAKDPENRLVSRGPRFRLDAEVIRDKALFSGGLLSQHMGGRGFKPYQPDGIWETVSDPASSTSRYMRDKDASIYRRSMYLFWKRTAPPPSMITFDAPLRDTCVVRRSSTNTPLQALTLQNEPAFLEAARTMSQRVLTIKGDDVLRIKRAFEIAMARPPSTTEISILSKALTQYRRVYKSSPALATSLLMVGDAPQAKLPPGEQAAWMIVCSTLMNTDEFLTLH